MYPSSRRPDAPPSLSGKDSTPWLEYDLLDIIGRGAFGIVWRCSERSTGRLFACKTLRKDESNSRSITAEVQQIAQLSHHRNVVRVFGSYESNQWVFVVMELCSEGDLLSFVNERRDLDEVTGATLFRDIVLGVDFCHRNNLLHRDIKPENILLSRVHDSRTGNHRLIAKVGDFGLARRLRKGDQMVGYAGSYPYVAPEVMANESYGWPADVWSLGVLLYSVLAGSVPDFQGGNGRFPRKPIHFFDRFSAFKGHPWRNVSPAAKSLICKMLSPRPHDRPSTAEILSDPWLNQGFRLRSKTVAAVGDAGSSTSFWLPWRPWSLQREECLESAVPTVSPYAGDTSADSSKFSGLGSSEYGQSISPLTPENHSSREQQQQQQTQQQQRWQQQHRQQHAQQCPPMRDSKRQVHAAAAVVASGRDKQTAAGREKHPASAPAAAGSCLAASRRHSLTLPYNPACLWSRNRNTAATVAPSSIHLPLHQRSREPQSLQQGYHQQQHHQHQHHTAGGFTSPQPSSGQQPSLQLQAEGEGYQQRSSSRGGPHQPNAHERSTGLALDQLHVSVHSQQCLPSTSTASSGRERSQGIYSSKQVNAGQRSFNCNAQRRGAGGEAPWGVGFSAREAVELLCSLWGQLLEAASEANMYSSAGDRVVKEGDRIVHQGHWSVRQEGGVGLDSGRVAGVSEREEGGGRLDISETFHAEVMCVAMDLWWERTLVGGGGHADAAE